MHLRKQMVLRIREGQLSVSEAAREYDVSRNTVRLWLRRSEGCRLEDLAEVSRRPHRIWRITSFEVETAILEMKAARPTWGAKKILAKLWPEEAPLSVRTADRILSRHGLAGQAYKTQPLQRFERSQPNELWQMDFKALGTPSLGYSPFTTLDDMSRFCLGAQPLSNHRVESIFEALWNLFGEYGLPERILSDNESCFADISRRGPSSLECKLWLLGIATSHGRPYHPQTQGKLERFHRTMEDELGQRIRQPDAARAAEVYKRFLHDYNFERPHESLGMKVPAQVYRPSARKRPPEMPKHEMLDGAIARKVDASGKFSFKGQPYNPGMALIGHYVQICEEANGYGVLFAGRRFATLEALRV